MSESTYTDSELFAGGPPVRLERSLGLIKPDNPRIIHRAILAGVIGWVPLVVLAAVQDSTVGGDNMRALLLDFAVYARSLIAAPLFVVAELVCIPQLGSLVYHFLDAGLVPAAERHHFEAAVASTRRLRDSTVAEIITIVLTYALSIGLIRYVPPSEFPTWHRSGGSEHPVLSFAGWWHVLVSVPLLTVLFFGWLWRLFLWGRLLLKLSRLDLQLIPAHPDHAGGLKFVGYSLRAFSLLGGALGTIVAGFVANHVIHMGVPPTAYLHLIGGLVVCVVILFSGPLLIFSGKLRQARRRGVFAYGALATGEGQQFERKWLNRREGIDESVLEAPDFSATTDLYQLVANVHDMRTFLLDLKDLVPLAIATLLPFVPVALMIVPLDVILRQLANFVL
uniref:Uncharacterized protein n=1 Tax=uncultured bacterium F41-01 TaxID=1191437 RepID=I3VIM7_9BACT|nr:conserved hypothetical protein [uncultured bacterium F41-01]